MPATARTYKEHPQLPIFFFGSRSFGFPNTYQPRFGPRYFSFQSQNITRPTLDSVTTTLSTLPKYTLSHRRSFFPVPVNTAEKLFQFLRSFFPGPSSCSYITYALQRHHPQKCAWRNCGMATSVVVVKLCITEKAFFAVPPLFLLPRYASSIEDLCALGGAWRCMPLI